MIGISTAGTAMALQSVQTEGGSAIVVGIVFASLVASGILAVAIAIKLLAGYRAAGDRTLLGIAIGLILLTTVPTAIRIAIPTALGDAPAIRISLATTAQLAGLLAILYVIRQPERTRKRVEHSQAKSVLPLPLLAPALPLVSASVSLLGTVTQGLTAVVGAYVAWQAFRGYRRNDSAPMAYLGIGILLVAVVPFVTSVVLGTLVGTTAALALLGLSLGQLGGVCSIYYSLTWA